MKKEYKAFYDLDEVRALSILDVCEAFGVTVERHGSSYFCKIRNEGTASCKLYFGPALRNGATYDNFYDFGSGKGGDVICFVAALMDCSWENALQQVAEAFNIQPVNNQEYYSRHELTDREYEQIGVHGDRASKNLDIDLERFSLEAAQKFSDKYSMPVNELRKQYPSVYEHGILRKRAIPFVYALRNQYYQDLHAAISIQKMFTKEFDYSLVPEKEKEELVAACRKVTRAEALLRKALVETNIKYSFRDYDVKTDLEKLLNGEISFEVGDRSYSEVKGMARKDGVTLVYRTIPYGDYISMQESLNEVPHAAFLKIDDVNLAFLPEYTAPVNLCLDMYYGRLVVMDEKVILEANSIVADLDIADKIPEAGGLYAQYHPRIGVVELMVAAEKPGIAGDLSQCTTIPLSDEEAAKLTDAVEQHCVSKYHVSCADLVASDREGLEMIQEEPRFGQQLEREPVLMPAVVKRDEPTTSGREDGPVLS